MQLNEVQQKYRRLNRKIFWIAVYVFVVILVSFLKLSEPIATFLAKSVSRPYRAVAGFLTSLVPFSVTEFFIIIAVVFGLGFLFALFAALFQKKFNKVLNKVLSLVLVILSVVALYSVTAQFDYARAVPKKPWDSATMSVEDYRVFVVAYAQKAGALAATFPKDENGYTIAPSFEETAKKMQKEAQKYAGGDYGYYAPLPKKVFNTWELDFTAILGITFAPTNEVSMNANINGLDLPYYMAHELAHAMGIMSEREANIYAAFLTLNAQDPYILYSGYRMLLGDLIAPISQLDSIGMPTFQERLAELVKKYEIPLSGKIEMEELISIIQRYAGEEGVTYLLNGILSETEKAYRAALGKDYLKDAELSDYEPYVPEWMGSIFKFFNQIGRTINDWYLKSSGVTDGTGDYNTGGSIVVPPPDVGDDEPSIPAEIVFSETVRIFMWISQK